MTKVRADADAVHAIPLIILTWIASTNRRFLDSPRTNGRELVVEHLELAGGVGGVGGPGRAAIRRGRHGHIHTQDPARHRLFRAGPRRTVDRRGEGNGTERSGADPLPDGLYARLGFL